MKVDRSLASVFGSVELVLPLVCTDLVFTPDLLFCESLLLDFWRPKLWVQTFTHRGVDIVGTTLPKKEDCRGSKIGYTDSIGAKIAEGWMPSSVFSVKGMDAVLDAGQDHISLPAIRADITTHFPPLRLDKWVDLKEPMSHLGQTVISGKQFQCTGFHKVGVTSEQKDVDLPRTNGKAPMSDFSGLNENGIRFGTSGDTHVPDLLLYPVPEMGFRKNSSRLVGVGMEFPPISTGSGSGYVSREGPAHDSEVTSTTNTGAISDVDGRADSNVAGGDLTIPTKSPGAQPPDRFTTTTGVSGLISHGSDDELAAPSCGYWEMGKVSGDGNTASADATIDWVQCTCSGNSTIDWVRRNTVWLLMTMEVVNGYGKRSDRRQGSPVRGKLLAMGTSAPPILAMASSLVPDSMFMSMPAPAALDLHSAGFTSPVGLDQDLKIRVQSVVEFGNWASLESDVMLKQTVM